MSRHKLYLYSPKKDTKEFKEGDLLESYTPPTTRLSELVVTNREILRINPCCRCPEYKKEKVEINELAFIDILNLDTVIN